MITVPLPRQLQLLTPAGKMSRRGSTSCLAPDHAAQDGDPAHKSAKDKYSKAAQKLFSPSGSRDTSDLPGDVPDDHNGSQTVADDTVPLEDPTTPLLPWDAVSTNYVSQTPHATTSHSSAGPEPTL